MKLSAKDGYISQVGNIVASYMLMMIESLIWKKIIFNRYLIAKKQKYLAGDEKVKRQLFSPEIFTNNS